MRRSVWFSLGLTAVLGAAAGQSQTVSDGAVLLANTNALHAPTTPAHPSADDPAAPAQGHTAGRMFGGVSEDRILDAIRNARVVGRHNVGSTSVNFHLELAGEIDAAWKPCYTDHCESYRAEIAAYRLNRLLGITRVPPAVSRTVSRASLRLARPASIPIVFDRGDNARGAAIYWVPVLRDSTIDQDREVERWSHWLRQGHAVPPDQSTRAEEISTLIAFDFLTGNWDRWSGSNVPMDAAGHLIYRDNNGGFVEPYAEALLGRGMHWLRKAQRFNRAVIDRARGLTESSVRAEMALDPDRDHPPLGEAQIRSLLRRRDALVQYVDGLVARHGAQNVYAW